MAMRVNLRQWFVWLIIAFVVVFIYRDPVGASAAIGPFLGSIGYLIKNIINSGIAFLGGLGGHR
jgi:hypothetical protein